MPTAFCSRTAAWAASTERGRPSVIGSTVVGNSTRPRTGTMIRASGGNGGEGAAPRAVSEPVAASAICGPRFLQRYEHVAIGMRPVDGAVSSGRQMDAAFKSALRQLESVDDGGPHFLRIGSRSRDQQLAMVDDRLDLLEVDSRQSDQHQHRVFGLEDVDRRLPG